MIIKQLQITNFRNLEAVSLYPIDKYNIFYGYNGSGKTSLLEAIYYLFLGRSFRSHLNKRIIQYGKEELVLFAKLDNENSLGLVKGVQAPIRIKYNQSEMDSIFKLTQLNPLLLIDANAYQIIDNSPKFRRQCLDWGVFHVEHGFFLVWQQYMHSLKQRNAAIRQRWPKNEVTAWDNKLCEYAESLTQYRKQYISTYMPILEKLLAQYFPYNGINVEFYPGWNQEIDFIEQLTNNYYKDYESGYTRLGPHRADLRIAIDKVPAKDSLSRGEKKLLLAIIKLAQGLLLKQQGNKQVMLLIDDLSSELDKSKLEMLIELIKALDTQTFITNISENINEYFSTSKLFHVEQGSIHAEALLEL